jgi:hypothetical protein
MQKGEDLEDLGTNAERRRQLTRPKWAQAFRDPVRPSFDLAAIRDIYSPEAKSHASIHSSSVVEEQRREGHHIGEEGRAS